MSDNIVAATETTSNASTATVDTPSEAAPKAEGLGLVKVGLEGKPKRPTIDSIRGAIARAAQAEQAHTSADPLRDLAAKKPAAEAKPEAPETTEQADPDIAVDAKDRQRWEMHRAELEQLEADLEAREKKLSERERSTDFRKVRDRYVEDRVEAIKDLVKSWSIAETDDDMKQELEDLATEIVERVLGMKIEDQRKSSLTNRKTQKTLKLWQTEQARTKQEAENAALESQRASEFKRAITAVNSRISGELASKYPWLSEESDAGELVMKSWQKQMDKDGTNRNIWEIAAELDSQFANYYKNKYTSYQKKNLLSAAESKADSKADTTKATPGDPTRKADHQAKEVKPTAPKPLTPTWKGSEAKRKATTAKIREILKNNT